MDKDVKRMIILDNYQNPKNRSVPSEKGYIKVNSNNESCIDNLDIYLKIENGVIKDIKFDGEACVICISSTSIITNMLIGKSIDEAREILVNYHNMIEEKEYDRDLLKEAVVYDDIYKQPSRKSCATLSTRGIFKVLENKNDIVEDDN